MLPPARARTTDDPSGSTGLGDERSRSDVQVVRYCSRTLPVDSSKPIGCRAAVHSAAGGSCHRAPPTLPLTVPPCILFPYVVDGCYARAHQMRRIITTRYRYCSEKVFSFVRTAHRRRARRGPQCDRDQWIRGLQKRREGRRDGQFGGAGGARQARRERVGIGKKTAIFPDWQASARAGAEAGGLWAW